MDKYIDAMGYRFKDMVTGYEGVCECVSFDLYGCVQYLLRPTVTKIDGKQEIQNGCWFDITRVKQLSKERVMEIPTLYKFNRTQPTSRIPAGPADKPAR